MSLSKDDLEQIRAVVREELDATAGLQEDPEVEQWMLEGPDGSWNVRALYSEAQLRMIESGRHVALSPTVLSIFHRSALAVRDGKRQIADNAAGDRLRQFMADNPDRYGLTD